MAERCPWKVHWGPHPEADVQCRKDDHVTGRRALSERREVNDDGRIELIEVQRDIAAPDPEHEALLANGVTVLHWYSGDRREYTGDWPGLCGREGGGPGRCSLPANHHGRCAP